MAAWDDTSEATRGGAWSIDSATDRAALRRSPSFLARLRARWAAVALATLLAFLGQSFLTQTHVDIDSGIRSVALAGTTGATTAKAGQPSPELPPCPICREIAHAGTYLPTVPVVLHAPAPVATWRVVIPSRVLALRQRSPDWRSRAPPLPLQA